MGRVEVYCCGGERKITGLAGTPRGQRYGLAADRHRKPSQREEFDRRGMRMAKVQFGGIVREASLDYVPGAKVGDYVLVHVGFAISTVDPEEAARTYQLLEEMDQLTELNAPVVDEVSARKPQ